MRITIDDDIDHDPRIMTLKCIVGDANALGYLVGAYRVATKYYVPDRKPIPTKLFRLIPWSQPLIDSGVAELTDDGQGIFIIQSEEQFGWVIAKHESGKKGGLAKASKALANSGELVANASEPVAEVSESYPPAPAPAPALSLAPVKNLNTKNLKALAAPSIEIGRFIGTYVKAYQAKYPPRDGKPPPRPDLRGKVQGQIKRFLEEVPIDRACDLIQAYCQMDDKWFKTKCHDFGSFLENQNKISLALDSGEDISQPNQTDWSKVFAEDPA